MNAPGRPARSGQAGSAGILACGLLALITVLVVGLGRVTAGVVSTSRAHTAALAAAGELAAGRSERDAERTASLTAAANGARLLRCDCGGPAVTVHVSVILPFTRSVSGLARAAARAELHPECPG